MADDMLEDMFKRQEEFMKMLEERDKLIQWPIDLTTKQGQRVIKEMMHNMNEEMFEASMTLRNRVHRVEDDRAFDYEHYREELGDALAFFMEICIMSGIDAYELYDEYRNKNTKVRLRLKNGY